MHFQFKIASTMMLIMLFLGLTFSATAVNGKTKSTVGTDNIHVSSWNHFADELYRFHQYQIKNREIRTEEEYGGYVGMPDFYREVRYYDDKTDKLLSRIQWEVENKDQVHVIEVFVYNKHGNLKSDYLAAFLPEHRNAPIQTLINIHYQNDELQSFRQFDASGARIYEQCQGNFFGTPIFITLDEDDFDSTEKHIIKTLASEEYLACFEFTSSIITPYFSPFKAIGIPKSYVSNHQVNLSTGIATVDSIQKNIDLLSQQIISNTNPGELYVLRGKQYFTLHEFESAISDYNKALELDDRLDDAYFGRGMAKGRIGLVKQGIDDLTVYINRNPGSSVAYTKRGVRYIWVGDLKNARKDLTRAIELSTTNAEAHDDMGVVNASQGKYDKAINHFLKVVELDPSYQKGFHNLAMAYHIIGMKQKALRNINAALKISPNEKNSLLLKSEILSSLDMKQEAEAITERAEFLPDGNWSERFTVQ